MRKLIVLPLLVAGTFAGTTPMNDSAKAPVVSAKSTKNPIAPSPNLYNWFAGGTAGYLLDSECEFFSGHVGRDLNYQLGGWDTATYLEVGYFGCDHDVVEYDKYDDKWDDKKYEDVRSEGRDERPPSSRIINYDLDVIPVTLNYKLERQITKSLNAYMGVGAGVAFMDLSTSEGYSDDDVVFFAQAFAGVLHNVTDSFEVYAGGRVIYMDDPSFNIDGSTIGFDEMNDHGFDIDNVDTLLEVGARFNF